MFFSAYFRQCHRVIFWINFDCGKKRREGTPRPNKPLDRDFPFKKLNGSVHFQNK